MQNKNKMYHFNHLEIYAIMWWVKAQHKYFHGVAEWVQVSGRTDERRQRLMHPRAERCLAWAPTSRGDRGQSQHPCPQEGPHGEKLTQSPWQIWEWDAHDHHLQGTHGPQQSSSIHVYVKGVCVCSICLSTTSIEFRPIHSKTLRRNGQWVNDGNQTLSRRRPEGSLGGSAV